MATMGREKTKFPGVYYIIGKASDGRPERIYYIQYRKNGKLIEEKAGRQFQDDMTPAKANGIRTDKIEGKVQSNTERREAEKAEREAEKNKWTIEKLWEEYKKQHTLKGLAQDESRYMTYIKPNFGEKEPSELIALDIDRVRLKLLKTKSPQTVKNILALLRRIVRFGANKGLCGWLGFTIQVPTKINNIKTEDFTPEQMKKFLEALDKDDDIQVTNLMRLILFTGMRRGELFRLQWQDVDFNRGVIHLRDPKSGRDETIPLNPQARKLLENHPKYGESPYVFPGRDGKTAGRNSQGR